MGSSSWSNDFYASRAADRAANGTSAFQYSADVSSGRVAKKTHEKMDPKGVAFRESRDSSVHPETLPIAIMCDVTGSMGGIPVTIQKQLPKLLDLLTTSTGYVEHPQILFGGVGDAVSDRGSIQIGQFESGIEMDEDLGRMWLEGGGGGSGEESYQNAIYFFARHTQLDSVEKRAKKGFLFLIGDELPYPQVSKGEVANLFGETLEASIPVADIIKEAQESYSIFMIIPDTHSARRPKVKETWETLLGADHVLYIQDGTEICETVALAIALTEGKSTLVEAKVKLASVNPDARVLESAVKACSNIAGASVPVVVRKNLRF